MALPIRFINLDRARERRDFMERQAKRLGLRFERVRAVEADEISDWELQRLGQSWERPLTKAELGCFLSHRRLWERVLKEGRALFILEDDAVLSPRLPAALGAAAEIRDIDLLNFEDFDKRRFVLDRHTKPLTDGLRRIPVQRDKAGAAAYLLWPSGARKLLARSERGAAPADAFIHAETRLNAWLCEPAVAIQAHVLKARGIDAGLETQTSIQAPREKLRPGPANAAFIARRLSAQLKLLKHQASRFGPTAYRRVEINEVDFR